MLVCASVPQPLTVLDGGNKPLTAFRRTKAGAVTRGSIRVGFVVSVKLIILESNAAFPSVRLWFPRTDGSNAPLGWAVLMSSVPIYEDPTALVPQRSARKEP